MYINIHFIVMPLMMAYTGIKTRCLHVTIAPIAVGTNTSVQMSPLCLAGAAGAWH
jgi:hypothetical protein